MFSDFGITHRVDLTFEDSRLDGGLLYSRVFDSPSKNNLLDIDDLAQIREKVAKSKSEFMRVVGHSLKMIENTRKIKEALSV